MDPFRLLLPVLVGVVVAACSAAEPLAEPPQRRVDRYGDPLPDRAIARLGTERLRHGGSVTALAYSADGKLLASASNDDNQVVVWEMPSGKRVQQFTSPGGQSNGLRFAGDGARLASLGGRTLLVWEVASGKEVHRDNDQIADLPKEWNFGGEPLTGNWPPVPPRAVSPDGKMLATQGAGNAILVSDRATEKELHKLTGHTAAVATLAFANDGKSLLSSGFDSTVRLWDLDGDKERLRVLPRHGNPFPALSPDGKTIATGGANSPHAVILWDAATGKQQADTYPGNTSQVSSIAVSPDGKLTATCSWLRGESAIWLWETATGKPVRVLPGHTNGTCAVVFSPDGKWLASSGWRGDQTVRIWDVETGRELRLVGGHQGGVTCLAVSPDGKRLAAGDDYYDRTGQYHGHVRVCDPATGDLLYERASPSGAVQAVRFTPDGRTLLVATDGVLLWDAADGGELGKLPVEGRIWSLAVSDDGRLLATTTCWTGPTCVWELATQRLLVTLPADSDGVRAEFAPGSRFLAVGTKAGVRVYDLALGELAGTFTGHRSAVHAVTFSPDGSRLLSSCGWETSALVWDAADLVRTPLKALPKQEAATLDRLREQLAGEDVGQAYRAVWTLVRVPEQALPLLRAAVRPVARIDAARLEKWLKELDDDNFEVREEATRQLEKMGELVEGALRRVLAGQPPPEQRRRVTELVRKLGPSASPERLRALRCLVALEQIGSPAARQLLTELAEGNPDARLTQDARATLARLAARR
jgi:WD40 repeat protein